MGTFNTAVRLSHKQTACLVNDICTGYYNYNGDPASKDDTTLEKNKQILMVLFTLPIGTPVMWKWETNLDTYVTTGIIHFCHSSKSDAKTKKTIRILEDDIDVFVIASGFLQAKNFGSFKRCVWEVSNHIIGQTITVVNRVYEKTYARCGYCNIPNNTDSMIKLNVNRPTIKAGAPDHHTYEYWCVPCNDVFSPDEEFQPFSDIEDPGMITRTSNIIF
jgi:hypothetical protein